MRTFDTRWIGSNGIGRFARELFRRMRGFDRIPISGRPASAIEPLRLTRYLRAARPELFFSPGYNAPLGSPCPFGFCLHDLNHLIVAENSNVLKRAYYQVLVKRAIGRACAVLTVSEFSRRQICDWADVDGTKVHNVGCGISEVFGPQGAAFTAREPYFLYVGNHKPHKNFPGILTAYARCGAARDLMLVSTGECSPALTRLIERLNLQGRVMFVGNPADEELARLYRGAVALLLVSFYEGFGLPIIEAMACGTPVLTSAAASMPEVAGGAALLVDPTDAEAIAVALGRLASDAELRKTLSQRGGIRAADFSWDTAARNAGAALGV